MPMFKCNETVQTIVPFGSGPFVAPWTVIKDKNK